MRVKDEVKRNFIAQLNDKYTIAAGYKLFLGTQEKCHWSKMIWNRWNFPKHSFICWLAWQDRITTRARVSRFAQIGES